MLLDLGQLVTKEAEIMNNNPNITYEEAHAMAEKVYDYNKELSEYLKNNYA